MKPKLSVALASLALVLSGGLVVAQKPADNAMDNQRLKRAEMHERLQNMSDEERAAFRAERRAKWGAMSDEEREAARAKRHEMREKRHRDRQGPEDE